MFLVQFVTFNPKSSRDHFISVLWLWYDQEWQCAECSRLYFWFLVLGKNLEISGEKLNSVLNFGGTAQF